MLRVAKLSCARGPRTLFRDLSFDLNPGEAAQITGPNGSGKTTLLRALAGLTRPEAGAVEWSGPVPIDHARLYVGHAQGWKDALTAAENLALALRIDSDDTAHDDRAVADALDAVGLARQRNLPVARLSQGQRKRLHLARLSRTKRPLWLLDEPSAALDDAGQKLLDGLLDAHLARGGIAAVATHQPLGLQEAVLRRVALAG